MEIQVPDGRVYVGERTGWPPEPRVYVEETGRRRRKLRHFPHHSPAGFEWGYGGSGPSDLALAVLADVLGERPSRRQLYEGEPLCWRLHIEFKQEVVSRLPREGFKLSAKDVLKWVEMRRETLAVGGSDETADDCA